MCFSKDSMLLPRLNDLDSVPNADYVKNLGWCRIPKEKEWIIH